MKVIITRGIDSDTQNLGVLQVLNDIGDVVFSCAKLELPYLDNKKRISSIPLGEYPGVKYQSPSKGNVILLKNTNNRSYIEIHAGNFYSQILGCCLVGSGFKDINKDGFFDVVNSKATLKRILALLPNDFKVEIS